jgi:hypothetical protein
MAVIQSSPGHLHGFGEMKDPLKLPRRDPPVEIDPRLSLTLAAAYGELPLPFRDLELGRSKAGDSQGNPHPVGPIIGEPLNIIGRIAV